MSPSNTEFRIPFTQYMRPSGRKVPTGFTSEREEVGIAAEALLDRGLVFEIEVLTNGMISATITNPEPADDQCGDLAHVLCMNEASVLPKIEKMILEFYHGR